LSDVSPRSETADSPSLINEIRHSTEGGSATNWGRWGAADERGTANLISTESVLRAAGLVRAGVAISLAHELALDVAPDNPKPAVRTIRRGVRGDGGSAADSIWVDHHGLATTHLDALCHVWDSNGMYNGRSPDATIHSDGATAADITVWREGIVTRALLIDVCRFRNVECVDVDNPVTAAELRAAVDATGLAAQPGDAIVVYSGRERWNRIHGQRWGAQWLADRTTGRPGLDSSCVEFFRDVDCGVLVWDMMDALPSDSGLAWPVHRVINELGVAVIDNARLGPLADFCAEQRRSEFMLVAAPLIVPGGTGSPINPIAIL
jgi:kynurenine formamidase